MPLRTTTKLSTAFLSIGLASLLLTGCKETARPYTAADEAMLPLFHPGDRFFVDQSEKARTDLHDGDVIVLRHGGSIVIKRILAMPGETIYGVHRKVFRDGKELDEPYLNPATGEGLPEMTDFPYRTVAPGELFVLGDNRDNSLDSRSAEYAPVLLSDVVGKYTWTYWHAPPAAKSN